MRNRLNLHDYAVDDEFTTFLQKLKEILWINWEFFMEQN